ncbi:MAG: hypothetical protein QM769_06065 [Pseudoxanthomonas sp.]
MNTRILLPMTASLLFAACTGAMLMSAHDARTASAAAFTPAATRIVDLPAVVVHPDPTLQIASNMKIVDLPAVVVRPDPANELRIVDLPAVVVHADAEYHDAWLASREPKTVELPALTVRPQVEDAPLVPVIATALVR